VITDIMKTKGKNCEVVEEGSGSRSTISV